MNKTVALAGKRSKIIINEDQYEKIKNLDQPPLFLLGFTGVGMIGSILTGELIEQFEMEQIGYVLSEDLPPMTIFYDGELKHPFRLYYDDKHNLLVGICEIPFTEDAYSDLARTIMDWALKLSINEIITFQGMASRALIRNKDTPVFAAGPSDALEKLFENGVKKPPKGIITGAEAAILNETLNNKLTGIIFLTAANPRIPAPEGAADILEKFGEIYGMDVELDHLLDQSDQIKQKLQEIQEQANKMHSRSEQEKPKKKLYT